jgi:ABC-2 type transport system ATP-binding protein
LKALVIQNLTKTYRNQVVALKGISFSVEQGDFFALLGPNGAGKSTTIGIISSLVNKTGGQVKVFDYDIDTQLSAAKACIGLVPQEFNCNIFEKVLDILIQQAGYYGVPTNVAGLRAEVYLKELGLWNKRDQLAGQLSGGLKRRLMIARALMHEPKLLILDEPTAGVDIELRRSLWVFIQEVNRKGTTVILTTHYLEEAESLCRNIAIIDHGKIIENASMKNILTKLHVETFIFYLETPLTESLIFGMEKFPARLLDEYTLEIDIHEGQTLNEVFDFFSNAGVIVKSMRNKANRLEELFIRLISNTTEVGHE